MKLIKLFLCFNILIGCSKMQKDFLNPSAIKIYPDERIDYSTHEIFGLRQIRNGGFLIFTVVSERGDQPRHISVLRLSPQGKYIQRTYLLGVDAFPTNILDLGNDHFEFICSPNPLVSRQQVLAHVSVEKDSILITQKRFRLDCNIKDCGMIFHVMKQGGNYITLNLGVDQAKEKEFNQVYIHKISANHLIVQSQIHIQDFDPVHTLGISTKDYRGFLEFHDMFFMKDINGRLLYHAPFSNSMKLRYLDRDQQNIYTSNFYMLASLTKNNTNHYDLILQDRRKLLASMTYLIKDFNISKKIDAKKIDSLLYLSTLGKIQTNKKICIKDQCYDYQKIPNIDPQKKVIVRYDAQNRMFIAATTQTGQVIIYQPDQKKKHYFGSGNPQYNLSDFIITEKKMVITGTTTLQIRDKSVDEEQHKLALFLQGKSAVFTIILKI